MRFRQNENKIKSRNILQECLNAGGQGCRMFSFFLSGLLVCLLDVLVTFISLFFKECYCSCGDSCCVKEMEVSPIFSTTDSVQQCRSFRLVPGLRLDAAQGEQPCSPSAAARQNWLVAGGRSAALAAASRSD